MNKLLLKLEKAGCQVRLSNKASCGYWWCYLTSVDKHITKQANSPKKALKQAYKEFKNDNESN